MCIRDRNFARQHTVAIDLVVFTFSTMTPEEGEAVEKGPDDGAFIQGLFMEGAGWNFEKTQLVESNPRELYVSMPVIHLLPAPKSEYDKGHTYLCPVYKTSLRKGVLSTTGHNSNFARYRFCRTLLQCISYYYYKCAAWMLIPACCSSDASTGHVHRPHDEAGGQRKILDQARHGDADATRQLKCKCRITIYDEGMKHIKLFGGGK